IHTATASNEIKNGTAEEKRRGAELRKRKHVSRPRVQHTTRHLARLRIVTVAEVDEQHRNLRIIETVQTERNHLDCFGARRLTVNRMILGIEVTSINIALPVEQSLVSPWIRDVQEA